jgi:nicotinamidase-related amidase
MEMFRLKAHYYQQFGADYARTIPGEGYGGWQATELDFSWKHSAVVVMHAWDVQPMEIDPAGYSECEYIPRADAICKNVFPQLLSAIRAQKFTLFHVVGHQGYYEHLPGYQRAVALAGPEPEPPPGVMSDPILEKLRRFRSENVWPGKENLVLRAQSKIPTDFHPAARPEGDEGVAANSHQLAALCREAGINHLIYAGFAVGGCLLTSPGGMVDMQRRGVLCSVLREAVTAIENKETARQEISKQLELWRVALSYGFVFDVSSFIAALQKNATSS